MHYTLSYNNTIKHFQQLIKSVQKRKIIGNNFIKNAVQFKLRFDIAIKILLHMFATSNLINCNIIAAYNFMTSANIVGFAVITSILEINTAKLMESSVT